MRKSSGGYFRIGEAGKHCLHVLSIHYSPVSTSSAYDWFVYVWGGSSGLEGQCRGSDWGRQRRRAVHRAAPQPCRYRRRPDLHTTPKHTETSGQPRGLVYKNVLTFRLKLGLNYFWCCAYVQFIKHKKPGLRRYLNPICHLHTGDP